MRRGIKTVQVARTPSVGQSTIGDAVEKAGLKAEQHLAKGLDSE